MTKPQRMRLRRNLHPAPIATPGEAGQTASKEGPRQVVVTYDPATNTHSWYDDTGALRMRIGNLTEETMPPTISVNVRPGIAISREGLAAVAEEVQRLVNETYPSEDDPRFRDLANIMGVAMHNAIGLGQQLREYMIQQGESGRLSPLWSRRVRTLMWDNFFQGRFSIRRDEPSYATLRSMFGAIVQRAAIDRPTLRLDCEQLQNDALRALGYIR